MTIRLSIGYIGVTLVSLHRYCKGYLQGLFCECPINVGLEIIVTLCVELRATIIGYMPPLVVYGSFKPLLGKTYMLHSGAHLSSLLACLHLAYIFLGVCSLCASWI